MTPIAEVARGDVVRDHRDADKHAENTWPCRVEGVPDAHVHVVEFTAALQVGVMPVVRGIGNGDRGRLIDSYVRILLWLIDAVVDGLGDGGKLPATEENDAVPTSHVGVDSAKDGPPVNDCLLSTSLD